MAPRPPLQRLHWGFGAFLAVLLTGFGLFHLAQIPRSEGMGSLGSIVALLFAIAGNVGLAVGMVLARFTVSSSVARLVTILVSPLVGVLSFVGFARLA